MALLVAQVGGNVTTATATISATFGSATTAGSLIWAIDHVYNTSGAAVTGDVVDNKSNSYPLITSSFGGAGAPGIAGYYNNGGARGASHQLTANLVNSAGESCNLAMTEITGQDPTAPLDTTTFNTATDAASPWDVPAAAAIVGNQVSGYGVTIDTGTNTAFTNPTGYSTIITQPNGVTSLVSHAAYKINETGTPTVGATSTHSSTAAREIFFTFKEAAAAAPAGEGSWIFIPDTYLDAQPGPFISGVTFDPALWFSVEGPTTTPVDVNVVGYLSVGAALFAAATRDATASAVLPVGPDVRAAATRDATVSGILPVGPDLRAGNVGHLVVGVLFVAPDLRADATRNATAAGILPVAVVPYGPATRDATASAVLPVGIEPHAAATRDATAPSVLPVGVDLRASATRDATAPSVLPVGIDMRAAATRNATISQAYLPVAATPFASATRNATVVGYLTVGVAPLVGAFNDRSVVGVLYVGALVMATATRDATVQAVLPAAVDERASATRTADVSQALLPIAVDPRAAATRSATVSGVLPLGADLRAQATRNATVVGVMPIATALGSDVSLVTSVTGRLYVGVTVQQRNPPPSLPADQVDVWYVERSWLEYHEADPLTFVEERQVLEHHEAEPITFVERYIDDV